MPQCMVNGHFVQNLFCKTELCAELWKEEKTKEWHIRATSKQARLKHCATRKANASASVRILLSAYREAMRLGRKSPDDVVLNNMSSRSHAQYMSTVVCGDLPKALSTQGKRGWATIFSLQNKSGVTKPFAAECRENFMENEMEEGEPMIYHLAPPSSSPLDNGPIFQLIR
ncbi:uncharacterized protein LOC120655386 isoform X2 [Panicum virgatum]|nr:uncharacterized protein LOC120655386 isoform X2 [Panicum virgatum]XP_039789104.1 uncharacterized protein LOC120655386 isoform X2 [Panicum virgatum]XP_039789105.1 uncharacterized protein LOC120655386 isoform X2 [Panicum virgatum]XP_039789106.1 uncharacterized protein LOC120655386 isoform X2 [Panicum virgatum]